MSNAPALFVSHGAPTFALEPGVLGPALTELGKEIAPSLKAILVVSAHWQTPEVRVMAGKAPATVHDFGGFPDELYTLSYPAPGSPRYAEAACDLLNSAGIAAQLDTDRGFDHGAWVPLRYLAPQAQLPVFQVSFPERANPESLFQIGEVLAPLRDSGVLIVGSGSLTHNLQDVFRGTVDREYATQFTEWIESALKQGDIARLLDYRSQGPQAARAHPTDEHLLPLFVALGASDLRDTLKLIPGGMTHGVLSMDSFLWSH